MKKMVFINTGLFFFVCMCAGIGCVTGDNIGGVSLAESAKQDGGRDTTGDGADTGTTSSDGGSDSEEGPKSTGGNEDSSERDDSDHGAESSDDSGGLDDTEEGEQQDTTSAGEEDTGADDPSCGGVGQECCDNEALCDDASSVCVSGYPQEGDAYCWGGCEPDSCMTVVGNPGLCYPTADPALTYCAPGAGQEPSYTCTDSYFCPGASECLVSKGDNSGYCYETGCDPIRS